MRLISPAPRIITSLFLRWPKIFSARSTATLPTEVEPSWMEVSLRTFLPMPKARWNRRLSTAGGGTGFQRRLIGLLHLAEDLGFSQHHRVQSADHAAEVARGRGFLLPVEVGGRVVIQRDFLREMADEQLKRGRGRCRGEIELGAVAGGNDDRLADAVQFQQLARRLAELRLAHGESFAHLHRCRLVIEAEAEKFHQMKAKTPRDNTNNTTVASDSRRPVSPRSDLMPNRMA